MRKIFLSVVTLVVLWSIFSSSSFAAAAPTPTPTLSPRYATCDACGLCPKIDVVAGTCVVDLTPTPGQAQQIPGDWKSCVKCLYPDLYPQSSDPNPNVPETCSTLIVDGTTNLPKHPTTPGRQFTMLGCITSGTSVGFDSKNGGAGGAPTFVQALLNVLFSITGGIAFLYLMYGGFIILTSQADPERLNYGRRLIYGAIAGLIITLSSVFIVNLIGSGILHVPGFSGTP